MISVVIPVYKKKEMFLKNLKHNFSYLQDIEIIIVNDYPGESLKKDLEVINAILVENKTNLGFGGAVNVGVEKASNNFVLLLNSDVVLHDDSFKKALIYFKKNKKLFAVSFAQKEKDGTTVGKNIIYWQNGFLHHKKASDTKFGFNAWAEGGTCILSRDKYLALGGFDQIYSPFYWEDIDLSYRAWKKGYEILFEPTVMMEHHHESTIGTYFSKAHVKKIAYRNQFIFTWKNITDKRLLINHFVFLLPNLLGRLIKGDFVFLKGFLLALLRIPKILAKRKSQKILYSFSDQEILQKFNE